MAPAASTLPHALWPLLILAVIPLWIAGLLEVAERGRASPRERSLGAAAVSAAAVVTILCIGAVFTGTPTDAGTQEPPPWGRDRAFIFSFGLEHAYHRNTPSPDDGVAAERRR